MLLFCFAWLELIWPHNTNPTALAALVAALSTFGLSGARAQDASPELPPAPEGAPAEIAPLSVESAAAMPGTSFTYQGRLRSSGAPVNGACDFQFTLWNASSVGTQIGPTVTKTGVNVSAGLFTTDVDFGSGAFNGEQRFLAFSCGRNAPVSRAPATRPASDGAAETYPIGD